MKKEIASHIEGEEDIVQGKWLGLRRLLYVNKCGHHKSWECAYRLKHGGAALMIAELRPSGRLILVRQFRPPLNSLTLEFPAGLIDEGETPADTAVRELYEETGYRGVVTAVFPAAANSPGLTGESVSMVMMSVDESVHDERPETPEMEDDEEIDTILVEPAQLLEFIRENQDQGTRIDSKLLAYALALNCGK